MVASSATPCECAGARGQAVQHLKRAWSTVRGIRPISWVATQLRDSHEDLVKKFGRAGSDAVYIGLVAVVLFLALADSQACTEFFNYVERHPEEELDAAVLTGLLFSVCMIVFSLRRWADVRGEVKVRIAAEARANAMAHEDVLTRLPNRRALIDELVRALARAKREDRLVSVLLLDLDRFKPVNDVYGHIAGDELLKEVAVRMRNIVRTDEFVARLGGDEFAVVVVHDRANADAPLQVARRLSQAVESAVTIGSSDLYVGASIGIAAFPRDAEDPESLMRRADVALYRAKESGRGQCRLFEESMDEEIRERSQIESELRVAIATEQVVPHFQPLVDLKTGSIVGFEALARWSHAVRGNITPSKFVPIAEECGLVGDLGLSILAQACRHARNWDPPLRLSINVSPYQLRDGWLAEKLLAVLVSTGFPAHRLEVEITENALVRDIQNARRILTSLKNQGVSISLDDFGSGYSSLQHLSSMPFDNIKIDRSFVQMLGLGAEGGKIIHAIVGLGKSLGLTTTGEGVETEENAALLRQVGCSVGQGWYFGRPVPADEVQALLARHRPALAASA